MSDGGTADGSPGDGYVTWTFYANTDNDSYPASLVDVYWAFDA